MGNITLTKIKVLDAQEGGNGDEVHFKFSSNGTILETPENVLTGMKAGDEKDINYQFSYNNTTGVDVSLVEDDGWWFFDPLQWPGFDTVIGTNHENVTAFEFDTFVFSGWGATYAVDYMNTL
jgi:hypothetical protein